MATSIPPHNAAELCDAALYLIEHPKAHRAEQLLELRAGPGFPDRRHHRRQPGGDRRGLWTGRGALPRPGALGEGGHRPRRLDHRRHRDSLRRAEVAADREDRPSFCRSKKLPLLADIRDESAEDVRIVLEPRARTVDPAILMESLFRLTELESRIPLNMNVLVGRQGAEGAWPRRSAARMARPSPRGAGAPLAPPPRRDREAPRNPRRLS